MNDEWPKQVDHDTAILLGRLHAGWYPGPLRVPDAEGVTVGSVDRYLPLGGNGVQVGKDFATVEVKTDRDDILEDRAPRWICVRLRGHRADRYGVQEITARDSRLVRLGFATPHAMTYELRDWHLDRQSSRRDGKSKGPPRFWIAELDVNGHSLPPGNVRLTWGPGRGFSNEIIRLEGTYCIYLIPTNEKPRRVSMLIDTGGQTLSREELNYDYAAMQFVVGGILNFGYLMALNEHDEIVQACAPPLSPFRGTPVHPPMSLSDGGGLSRQLRHLRATFDSGSSLTAIRYWHASQLHQPEHVAWSNLGQCLLACGALHRMEDGSCAIATDGEPSEKSRELFQSAVDALELRTIDEPRQRLFDAQRAVAAALLWHAGHRESLDATNRVKELLAFEDYRRDAVDHWLAEAIGVERRRFSWGTYSWRGGKVEGLLGQFEEYAKDFGRTNGPTLYATLSPRLREDGSNYIERYQFRLHARISPRVSVPLFAVHPSDGRLTIVGWHDEPLEVGTHEELISFLEKVSNSDEFRAQVTNLLILAEEQEQ